MTEPDYKNLAESCFKISTEATDIAIAALRTIAMGCDVPRPKKIALDALVKMKECYENVEQRLG